MIERQTVQAALTAVGVILAVVNVVLYVELWLCRQRMQDLLLALLPLGALAALALDLYRLQALLRGQPITIGDLVRLGVLVLALVLLLVQAIGYFREDVP